MFACYDVAMLLATLLLLQAPDTVRLGVDEALRRAVADAPALVASMAAESAATARIRQAGSWRNPVFSGLAENIGAQEPITGHTGLAGIEGQLTLEQTLTIGGDRGAAIREARALAAAAGATTAVTIADIQAAALEAISVVERDRRVAAFATEEAQALERIAHLMDRRAAEGRTSGGDAARTRMEAVTTASAAARRRARAVESEGILARLLLFEPGTLLLVETGTCAEPPPPTAATGVPPDLLLAQHTVAAHDAAVARADALRVPDLRPIAGLRRTAGFSGLLLGLSLELPIMPGPAAGADAARADLAGAAASRDALARNLAAEQHATRRAATDLDQAGAVFDSTAASALERAVRAAFARYGSGEGTLVELLDARRARLAFLTEFEEWRTALRLARIRSARTSGLPLDGTLLCTPGYPEES